LDAEHERLEIIGTDSSEFFESFVNKRIRRGKTNVAPGASTQQALRGLAERPLSRKPSEPLFIPRGPHEPGQHAADFVHAEHDFLGVLDIFEVSG
jgi:hypothetical protein